MTASLHELNGRTGTRLGPMWTSLVVAQIAVAVAVLPVAVYLSWQVVRLEIEGPGFAADEFVVSIVALSDEDSAVDSGRVRARHLELTSRLEAEPGVSAVTFSSSVPGFAGSRRIQFEDPSTSRRASPSTSPGAERQAVRDARTPEVSTLNVGVGMFETYGASMLAGRAFSTADLGAANAVIVNRTFVREFLEYGSALGRRFRYTRARASQPDTPVQHVWYQIVGVVRDFPGFSPAPFSEGEPTVYHPAAPGDVHPLVLSVRFAGNIPAGFVDRFREIGAEVDPALQLRRVVPLSTFYNDVRSVWRYLAWGIGLVTTSVLLLSAAGIYALMSFTIAQRTREIGIRIALGAHPRRILFNVFGRAIRQLALGVLVGSILSGAAFSIAGLGLAPATALLLAVVAMMLIVGLLAALGPARRGLAYPGERGAQG